MGIFPLQFCTITNQKYLSRKDDIPVRIRTLPWRIRVKVSVGQPRSYNVTWSPPPNELCLGESVERWENRLVRESDWPRELVGDPFESLFRSWGPLNSNSITSAWLIKPYNQAPDSARLRRMTMRYRGHLIEKTNMLCFRGCRCNQKGPVNVFRCLPSRTANMSNQKFEAFDQVYMVRLFISWSLQRFGRVYQDGLPRWSDWKLQRFPIQNFPSMWKDK